MTTSISIKTINFESDSAKKDGAAKEFKLKTDLIVNHNKTVAYTVRWQLARRRAGTAKVKTMAEISGTTAKPYNQKGTGNARQGSRRSVQFVGGRTCHGPTLRSYDFAMPKKIIKKSLSDAIKLKLQEDKFSLFADVKSDQLKTAKINKILATNEIKSALIVLDFASDKNKALVQAVSNLKNVKALDIKALNTYDLLKFDQIIVDNKIFETNILGALK